MLILIYTEPRKGQVNKKWKRKPKEPLSHRIAPNMLLAGGNKYEQTE